MKHFRLKLLLLLYFTSRRDESEMVEHWMKTQASKSLGGPCMSKFLQEREQKRIARLHNVKSSFSNRPKNSSAINRNKRGGVKSRSDKTTYTNRCAPNGDFQLRNLCVASARSKSGLKITVPDYDAASRSSTKRNLSVATRINEAPSSNRGKQMNDNLFSEEKENWTPSHSAKAIRRFKKKTMSEETSDPRRCKAGSNVINIPKVRVKDYQKMENMAQNRQNASASKWDRNNRHKSTKLKIDGPNRKSYVNRGVSINSLVKERADAMNILKEIDDANLIGKMSDMQIAMDPMGANRTHHREETRTNIGSESRSEAEDFNIESRKSHVYHAGIDNSTRGANHMYPLEEACSSFESDSCVETQQDYDSYPERSIDDSDDNSDDNSDHRFDDNSSAMDTAHTNQMNQMDNRSADVESESGSEKETYRFHSENSYDSNDGLSDDDRHQPNDTNESSSSELGSCDDIEDVPTRSKNSHYSNIECTFNNEGGGESCDNSSSCYSDSFDAASNDESSLFSHDNYR